MRVSDVGVFGMLFLVLSPVAVQAEDSDGDGVIVTAHEHRPVPVRSEVFSPAKVLVTGSLLTVGWNTVDAEVGSIDPTTGDWTPIGQSGWQRLNALAVNAAHEYYSASKEGQDGDSSLIRIDSSTGVGTLVAALAPGLDIRALAFSSQGMLYAVSEGAGGADDELYVLDVVTGAETYVGVLTGFRGVQGLAFSRLSGELFAWDVFEGLLHVDPISGIATDIDSAIPGSAEIQTITGLPNGYLVGGGYDLYSIDPLTGNYILNTTGNYPDLRGIEFAPPRGLIFANGFELGDTDAWSSAVSEP